MNFRLFFNNRKRLVFHHSSILFIVLIFLHHLNLLIHFYFLLLFIFLLHWSYKQWIWKLFFLFSPPFLFFLPFLPILSFFHYIWSFELQLKWIFFRIFYHWWLWFLLRWLFQKIVFESDNVVKDNKRFRFTFSGDKVPFSWRYFHPKAVMIFDNWAPFRNFGVSEIDDFFSSFFFIFVFDGEGEFLIGKVDDNTTPFFPLWNKARFSFNLNVEKELLFEACSEVGLNFVRLWLGLARWAIHCIVCFISSRNIKIISK